MIVLVPTAPARTGDIRRLLRARNDAPTLRSSGDWLGATELAELIDERARRLGSGRRLVAIDIERDIDSVVSYLAALDAGHAVILSSPDALPALVDAWRPDTIVVSGQVDQIRHTPATQLHHDLALLLSTSGSTGSPKLVRLSRRNIAANAASIAEYLGLTDADVGITTLPLHYCYGLSVLHSHLLAGARVQLTDLSVVDPCFWSLVDEQAVTNIAGVPHTFELLDHSSTDRFAAPSLRFVTQAGGRLAPERVGELAASGRRHGWDLFVMYGQTEATARMAYLPPSLASEQPDAVGLAVPGGSFEIRSFDDGQLVPVGSEGRVVYRGSNVMMGYATESADLALGDVTDELVTGDLGTLDADGVLRITGRESRFAKIFGLRVDLQRVEHRFAGLGHRLLVTSDDHVMIAAVERAELPPPTAAAIAEIAGLRPNDVVVIEVDELPLLSSGKPDLVAVRHLAEEIERGAAQATQSAGADADIAAEFRAVLGAKHIDATDTFVSLGGDSMSYVELSIRLERRLGQLPDGWHLRPIAELDALATTAQPGFFVRRFAQMETTTVLRAVAIMCVVSVHMSWYMVTGGAHVLLAIAGYNFARFQLDGDTERPGWLRSMATPFAKIAIITSAWIATLMVVFDEHSVGSLFLVNNYVGDPGRTEFRWRYWYIEAMVQIGILLVAFFAARPVRRFEARHRFLLPLLLLGASLIMRFDIVQIGGSRNDIFRTDTVIWLFLLGWAIQRAGTAEAGWWQRLMVSAAAIATVPGYFFDDDRGTRLLVALLAMIWITRLPVPRPLDRVIGTIAAASLTIYLTHYVVFRELDDFLEDRWVFPLTIGIGVICWWLGRRVADTSKRAWHHHRAGSLPVPTPTTSGSPS